MHEPTFYILAALVDGPRHGYGVIAEVRDLSEGRVALSAGTLYGALDRLARLGHVRMEREEVVNGRARRYYGLTAAGRRAIVDEAERMRSAARVVDARLGRRVQPA